MTSKEIEIHDHISAKESERGSIINHFCNSSADSFIIDLELKAQNVILVLVIRDANMYLTHDLQQKIY